MTKEEIVGETHPAYAIRYTKEENFKVEILDKELRYSLQEVMDCTGLYESPPVVDSASLLLNLKALQLHAKSKTLEEEDDEENEKDEPKENGTETEKKEPKKVAPVVALVAFLEKKFEFFTAKAKALTDEGKITFDLLTFAFSKGDKVSSWELGSKWGGELYNTYFQESFFGRYFRLVVGAIESDGEKFHQVDKEIYVSEFDGVVELSSLQVQHMTDTVYDELKNRGKLYQKYGLDHHFKQYKGNICRKTAFGSTNKYRADGRIMVDGSNFRRFNPDYKTIANHRATSGMTEIPESKLYMCWPLLKGFSFYAKKWGEIFVEQLSDIQFQDQAFESLVLEQETKSLLKAVVQSGDETFSDIISGKGDGIILLFHGSPGVGKTLTAEAIAEQLYAPLYMVSVGELGTNASTLEENLREILEVSRAWNAVVLIDEADIFLEKRTESDIKRNAMVGVFLRLLEYHQGILILTTNRVRSFDAAFYSRITLALKYDSLDNKARIEVWRNLMNAAKLPISDSINLEVLAAHELNGRQIKNTIKVAQALATNEKVPLKTAHFERGIKFTIQFLLDTAN